MRRRLVSAPVCLVSALVTAFATAACSAPVDQEVDSKTPSESTSNFVVNVGSPLGLKLNANGFARTASSTGAIDSTNPFFLSLGTNDRACVSCHQVGEGWSVTPLGVQLRFLQTDGMDPIFRNHDGANSPLLDVSTVEARRSAYSLLLERAVIRIGLPVKADSEFELSVVDDPYGWASATQLSLFRRPLPTTNLRFLGTVSWDGRNTIAADPTNVHLSLKNQSNGASVNHAKVAAPIADDVREAIVAFETSITTAQAYSFRAGALDGFGARGGPDLLQSAPFTVGMGAPPAEVFSVFSAWGELPNWAFTQGARDVAEGEQIFTTKTFGPFGGTCSGCHDAQNVGGNSGFEMFDVGISAPARRASNVPLYTFRNKTTGETLSTTDPGRALISGKWADMNKFKVPGLRALSARAPYFHDGSAKTLGDVVRHYDEQFAIGLTCDETRKLTAFLEAL